MSVSRFAAIVSLIVVAALTIAGCGGGDDSSPIFARQDVEKLVTDGVRAQLSQGTNISDFQCVRDGDDLHWKCLADYTVGQTGSVSMDVTCDAETLYCIWQTA